MLPPWRGQETHETGCARMPVGKPASITVLTVGGEAMLEMTTRPNATTVARRRVIGPVVLALVTGIAGAAHAQPPDPAASTPTVRLFTGARVIVGDGRVIEDAAFLTRGSVIAGVGSTGEVTAPPGAAVVDLTGRTVMPALVNTHAHLGWERYTSCLLYTSPSPRDGLLSRMPSSA